MGTVRGKRDRLLTGHIEILWHGCMQASAHVFQPCPSAYRLRRTSSGFWRPSGLRQGPPSWIVRHSHVEVVDPEEVERVEGLLPSTYHPNPVGSAGGARGLGGSPSTGSGSLYRRGAVSFGPSG